MALLTDQPPMELNDPGWVVHTQSADRPPVRFEAGGRAEGSLIANGCRIAGTVERSVLFPGVQVSRGALVRDSIVMHDCVIGADALLDRAILDKEARVGAGTRVGDGEARIPNRACPQHLSSGLVVVGRRAELPEGLRVGRNARIGAGVREEAIRQDVPAGGVVHGPEPEH